MEDVREVPEWEPLKRMYWRRAKLWLSVGTTIAVAAMGWLMYVSVSDKLRFSDREMMIALYAVFFYFYSVCQAHENAWFSQYPWEHE